MEPTGVHTVAVVGTGLIGTSWTAFFLAHGLSVRATDPADGADTRLKQSLDELMPVAFEIAGKGVSQNWKKQLSFHTTLEEAVGGADFVQESGPERIDLKRDLYAKLDAAASPNVILASSSSGLLATQFAAQCKHPERVLVCHPFHPPHILPLVEIVPGKRTTSDTTAQATAFYEALGKRPVLVKKEVAGFIGNRLQAALVQEAIHLLESGVASAEDIDAVVTCGMGPRWALLGPFMNMQLNGGPKGARGFLEHIGPAFESYWRDLGRVEIQPKLIDSVCNKVDAQVASYDANLAAIKQERDRILLDMLKAKLASQYLV